MTRRIRQLIWARAAGVTNEGSADDQRQDFQSMRDASTARKYDARVDPHNINNSHSLIVEMVGRGKRVLDLGCATGFLAAILREHGCHVVGVDSDPDATEVARMHCDRVLTADIEEADLTDVVDGETFDVVVLGDVLEHLKVPNTLLRRVLPLLRADGYVVASIPNVAHGSVRLALLQGRFDYSPRGLLDETHLRFYTWSSIQRLFEGAGYEISEIRRTKLDFFGTEILLRPDDFPSEVRGFIQRDPEATTYQFVLRAVRS